MLKFKVLIIITNVQSTLQTTQHPETNACISITNYGYGKNNLNNFNISTLNTHVTRHVAVTKCLFIQKSYDHIFLTLTQFSNFKMENKSKKSFYLQAKCGNLPSMK